ncbi:hypothetical protein N7474_001934 [Penicillium riverlandense]|uniref:uncharacterized protein n=1 Tax=Penicillium riverlandense TaxID=1903569 RepID=UPI002549930D|nr:uncharacterized protein N7474_001934 [Penicillium riverlandense]KAJ5833623.1 hypothetical protein N7474_001934 [Penicillium riverlandense]
MEAAPLTLAHTHARNAVLETRKSNPVAASEEHDLAAGEFAAAAQSSVDHELLESHHKKLAEILRFQHEHPVSANSEPTANVVSPNPASQPSSTDVGALKTPHITPDAQNQPPRLPGNARVSSRETSSIASDLASARGIPAHPRRASPVSPTLSSQQAGAKMAEAPPRIKAGDSKWQEVPMKGRRGRASTPRQPWSPPLPSAAELTSQQAVPPSIMGSVSPKDTTSMADEPFQRFYSTFEGLISRISAPLAFAGLPLGRKSAAEAKLDRHHATSDRSTSSAEPDVSRLFSRAALRSIQDTPGTSPGNPNESFYVVPTTGGTMSYAGILTRAEKEARRNSLEDADDDFVDARETPSSPEVRQGSNSRTLRRGATEKITNLQNPKTLEELQMENQALKHLSDTLSKRLHMWEVNAQSSSMALQQSLRAMHHHNVPSPEHALSTATSPTAQLSSAPAMSESDPRVKELEEIVRRGEQELERVGRENEKLTNVLGRYRDRWEKLKEGAKTRRAEGRAGGDAQSNPPAASPNTPKKSEGPVSPTVSSGASPKTAPRVEDSPAVEAGLHMDIGDT